MRLFVLMRRSLPCLALIVLSSCASTPQPSQTSFSESQVREVRAEQKAADCAKWKNDPLPLSIQTQITAASLTMPEHRTLDQVAIMDWFNREAAAVTERQTYCKEQ